MTAGSSRDPIAALNEVLSEVIDVVMALRQAHHRVPEGRDLHAELDQLFDDAKNWAQLLMQADTDRGVSALSYMPTVAGRHPPDLSARSGGRRRRSPGRRRAARPARGARSGGLVGAG